MNIILVVFDSLRKDCVGAYGKPFWGKVHTPWFDRMAEESVLFTSMYPESLPTLPTRRAIYTGERIYPFHEGDYRLKGDFVGAAGWGPIREDRPTLAERLSEAGYRTGLISDVYHQFKPSKNFWRGFQQWQFLRGQEKDPARSGPRLTQEQLDYWLPRELQNDRTIEFIQQCIMNIHDRSLEEEFFSPQVLRAATDWLQQNRDANKLFLTVESFDPHEPWLVPQHYLRMYLEDAAGPEQVKSGYSDTSQLDTALLRRTQANYSGSVTQCDRWFGYLLESMRVLGLLDNTLLIFTTDHGHSIGDRNYMGKRGYPSAPEVYDVPLMIRFPGGENAGTTYDGFVQHHDLGASILEYAGVDAGSLNGRPFLDAALEGKDLRDHVTVGWGSAVTVIDRGWWFNAKVDGTGVLLYDRNSEDDLMSRNAADENPDVVRKMFARAEEDAEGGFPEYILEMARNQTDAPGCSDLAARA